ncbi:alpha/beta fold hydrolase [Aquirhabdus parva]|uniref:Alpha/beta hydrolase n=1 Tax=Aquirhabdus parva TaxID=2283318 RepID=A0A345P841_9GAMM|nr:alpha/beta hydrolase [Aquirhabdus parva]AXI03450.1 alpha/beta hydrolase [Aquirhabdus parva]
MSDFVENSVESFIDELQSALKNNPKPINIKALKNWEPSGLTTALLRKVQGYATGMKRRSTFVKSQKIVWLEGGNPHGEPVLLLHGFASSKENWVLLLPYLTRRYRVFVPDLPGWGESEFNYVEQYSLEKQLDRVDNWTGRYMPSQFHIVGSSMGGGIAALFTARHPEKILSLTLMNALGVFGSESTHFEQELKKGNNHLIAHRLTDVVRMMSTVMSYNRWTLTALLVPLMYQELVSRRHINQHMFHQLLEHAPPTMFEGIAHITSPTLVLWGEKDRILHASCATVFKQLIPQAEVKIFSEVGHLPMVEVPQMTARALLGFWRQLSKKHIAKDHHCLSPA